MYLCSENLYRANGRGGFGSQTAADPLWWPSQSPWKQTVGTVTASHKMLTLQALLSSLNAGRGGAFGCPPAVCPPKRPRPFAHYRILSWNWDDLFWTIFRPEFFVEIFWNRRSPKNVPKASFAPKNNPAPKLSLRLIKASAKITPTGSPCLSRLIRPFCPESRLVRPFFGHFLRGRSLKGRCNICVYVPVFVPVCVPRLPPMTPPILWGWTAEFPPTAVHNPWPPFPHPYLQAIARPTLGKNYPLKSARFLSRLVRTTVCNNLSPMVPCPKNLLKATQRTLPWAAANGGVTNGGLRGVWPPFLEIGRNRPFSPFFCLFRRFPEGAKSTWETQRTEEKGLFPQITSAFLKPPSLKPPFAALQLPY